MGPFALFKLVRLKFMTLCRGAFNLMFQFAESFSKKKNNKIKNHLQEMNLQKKRFILILFNSFVTDTNLCCAVAW